MAVEHPAVGATAQDFKYWPPSNAATLAGMLFWPRKQQLQFHSKKILFVGGAAVFVFLERTMNTIRTSFAKEVSVRIMSFDVSSC